MWLFALLGSRKVEKAHIFSNGPTLWAQRPPAEMWVILIFFCKKFSKGYTLPQKWLFGKKSHLKPIFDLKCVKIVNFPIIPIHLYRKTPDFHKSRYLAPVARGWPKLFTDFECMSCRELMGQVPIWVPEADKKCHVSNTLRWDRYTYLPNLT